MKTALSPLLDQNTADDATNTANKGNLDRLLQFLVPRVQAVDSEMLWWRTDCAMYELQADNDFSFRRTGARTEEDKSIFDHSNESLNMIRGVARYMKGRCEGDLFGGSPWFNAKAEGLQDDDLADALQKHLDFKLRQAGYRPQGKSCIGTVIDLGSAVQKTTWKVTREPYERMSSVFHGPDENPVLESSPEDPGTGDYVEQGHPSLLNDQDGNTLYQPPGTGPDGQPLPAVMGKMKPMLIHEENVKYKGLNWETIPYKNLLAPMGVAKFDDADLLGHFYDVPFFDLQAHYDPNGNDPDLKDVWDKLQTYHSGAPTGDRAAKGDESPVVDDADKLNPMLQIHELRVRFAADGKNLRRLYIVIHLASQTIIHADYLGNMTPAGDLDMHPVVINKVPGRWYGRGYYKVYAMLQRLIDRCLNMIEYHNGFSSDPIKIVDTRVTEETEVDGELRLHPGKLFQRKAGADPALKLLELITLPNLDDRTWQMMELAMQILQQDSGVTAAAQGDPGALPSVSTATGTNAILSSGSTMHQLVIDDMKDGIEPALSYAMRLLYARQDADETFSYLQGDRAVQSLLSLADAQQLSRLYLQVSLSLTRIRNQEQRQSAQSFLNSAIQYYTLSPQAQMGLRPGFIQLGKGYEMENVDAMFPMPQLAPPPVAGLPGGPAVDPNAAAAALPAPDPAATPSPAATPAAPAGGAPINILTTGAAPAQPLPVNVIPAQAPANQGNY